MLLWIVVITFFTMLAAVILAAQYLTQDKRVISERMNRYIDNPGLSRPTGPAVVQPRKLSGWRSVVRRLSRFVDGPLFQGGLDYKLARAGLLLKGSEYAVIMFGLAAGMAILMFITGRGNWLLTAAGGAGGGLLPIIYLNIRIQRRARTFNNQLGEALVLTSNSLRTGFSFMQALEMVSREMPAPLSVEFARVIKEMNLGVNSEDAMNNMLGRIDSADLDLVVTAYLIQRQVGGNLAEILDKIADTIRERVRMKGEIKTLTAQGRISGLIIGFLPVVLGAGLYLLNPKYISMLFTDKLGKLMLMAGMVSQVIGLFLIRRIVNIDV